MEVGRPSETAHFVAILRAHHLLNAPEPKILRDTAAQALAGITDDADITGYVNGLIQSFTALSDAETAKIFVRRIEESVCMRSRLVQWELEQGRKNGIEQFVILGAGLDAAAYGQQDYLARLDMFEVDYPATQDWKRTRLQEAGFTIPDNLSFVPFDFEHQTLGEALDAGGVDKDAVTLFSWLGVQPYLTDEAVRSTLSVLGTFKKGSRLVMDFIMPDYAIDDASNSDSISQLGTIVAEMREPFKSRYTTEDLETRFETAGFDKVEFHTTQDMVNRVLNGDADKCSMAPEAIYLLTATV